MKQVSDIHNLAEYIALACEDYGARPAFFESDVCLTYGEWWDRSEAVAAFMRQKGIVPGHRVAVILPNGIAFPIVTAAVLRLGCIQVNCNPLYTPRELGHQLHDAGVRTAVLPATALPTLIAAAPRDVEHVILTGVGNPSLLEQAPSAWTISMWDDVLAGAPDPLISWPAPTRDDLAFLQYTGGTTGPSKGAMLTHGNILANIEQFMDRSASNLDHGDIKVLTAIPLYHIFALTVNLFSSIALGAANVLIADPRNLDQLIDAWHRHDVNFVTGVNTLFKALGAHPGFQALRFHPRLITMGGGATVQPVVSAQWNRLTGGHIKEGYGLSETSPILTCTPLDEPRFLASVGLPVKNTQIVLRDEEGQDVEDGAIGELCARGPQVMKGYWRNPEATAATTTADGFFRTGDMARCDRDGRYYIVDRLKDMILVSGFNVYPNEIEAVTSDLPGVVECACIGVPDGQGCEAVALYIVRRDETLSAEIVMAHCRRNLTAYKVPRHIHFIETMPKSAVGKLLRRELRAISPVATSRKPGASL
jgi:long-chain acyl-CoA synthetase